MSEIECQKECQIECQKECQIECQNECQIRMLDRIVRVCYKYLCQTSIYIFAMVGITQRKVFNLRHNPTHECCGVEYMWVCFKATASNENFIVACRNEKT